MTVKLFRLITGEDLITEVKENLFPSEHLITLDNPAVIALQPSKDGQNVGVGIAPYMPLVGGDVILHRQSIVAEGAPDEKLENEYRSRFGSGIVVAPASVLNNIK